VHLQLTPLNPAPTFFSALALCTHCTAWLRLRGV